MVSNLFSLLSKEDHLASPRRREQGEVGELAGRRADISRQCKTCGKIGHNKRSCKGEIGGNSSLPSTTNRTSVANKVTFYHICQVNV